MKYVLLIVLLTPIYLFAQDGTVSLKDCWQEYAHENLPYPESEHCPLILCPDNSTVCHVKDDQELYTTKENWSVSSDKRIIIRENGTIFIILMQTDSELHLQSVEYSDFKIFLKK